MVFLHIPVLLEETISFLQPGVRTIIDFTIGGGNHALALLDNSDDAFLYGIDRDEEAIEESRIHLQAFEGRFELLHASFSSAIKILQERNIRADFILADLGVSSHQLSSDQRGFSFMHEGPLDMRMNAADELSAERIVNEYEESDLIRIIKAYGEEQFAARIARSIVKNRQGKPISTTTELTRCILEGIPKKFQFGKIHPATKTFQALRIEVNKEIDELIILLENALDLMNPRGRLAVISFHSLEDRPVKQAFKQWEDPCTCPKTIPVCVCGKKPLVKRVTRNAVKASRVETETNKRSRSARLRIIEKL